MRAGRWKPAGLWHICAQHLWWIITRVTLQQVIIYLKNYYAHMQQHSEKAHLCSFHKNDGGQSQPVYNNHIHFIDLSTTNGRKPPEIKSFCWFVACSLFLFDGKNTFLINLDGLINALKTEWREAHYASSMVVVAWEFGLFCSLEPGDYRQLHTALCVLCPATASSQQWFGPKHSFGSVVGVPSKQCDCEN